MTSFNQNTTTAQAAVPGKTAFVPIAFSLAVQGTYAQVLDVLHRLEKGAHYCRIQTASVSRIGGEGVDMLNLSLSLELLGQR